MRAPNWKLSWSEKIALIESGGVQPGEIVSLDRGHPHISRDTPYEHTDVLAIQNDGGILRVIGFFHVPTVKKSPEE